MNFLSLDRSNESKTPNQTVGAMATKIKNLLPPHSLLMVAT